MWEYMVATSCIQLTPCKVVFLPWLWGNECSWYKSLYTATIDCLSIIIIWFISHREDQDIFNISLNGASMILSGTSFIIQERFIEIVSYSLYWILLRLKMKHLISLHLPRKDRNNIGTISKIWLSTERQRFLLWHFLKLYILYSPILSNIHYGKPIELPRYMAQSLLHDTNERQWSIEEF
jgi:hypothetical protein